MEASDNILIFKTNVRTAEQKQLLQSILEEDAGITNWTIDQDDVDCVLRIIAEAVCEQYIISKLNDHGFLCIELI